MKKHTLSRLLVLLTVLLVAGVLLGGCAAAGGTKGAIKLGGENDNFQLFDIVNVPFGYVIRFCYALVPNYAVALLFFAIVIKVVLFPLGIKQQKNSVRQARMKPKEMAIRNKYKGRDDQVTKQKMNEDIMKLYNQENYNPLSGCMPLLVQMPILIALYNIIRNPLKYICNLTADIINELQTVYQGVLTEAARLVDPAAAEVTITSQIELIGKMKADFAPAAEVLSGTNVTLGNLPNFELFPGFNLGIKPPFSNFDDIAANWPLLFIPVFVFISMYLSMKITRKMTFQPMQDTNEDAMKSMKIMDYTMPLMSVAMSFTFEGIIGLYWIYQSALGVVQQFILFKMYPLPKFTEEDFKLAEKELGGSSRKPKQKGEKKKVRSLHHIDDEDYEQPEPEEKKPDKQSRLIEPAKQKDDDDNDD